ncbi:hypothetical protein ABKN59_010529 [Abortiporus biennis]
MTDAAGPLNVTGAFVVDWFGTTSCVACTALIIYDYSITIDQEVQHIWKTRLNLTSVLFVITRYCSLLVVLGYVAFDLFPTSRSSCLGLWFFMSAAQTLLTTASGIFFVLRTWAIWGRHLLPLAILTPLGLAAIALPATISLATRYVGFEPKLHYGRCVMASMVPNALVIRRTEPTQIVSRNVNANSFLFIQFC